jgi:polysaccharide export outer membrane protein
MNIRRSAVLFPLLAYLILGGEFQAPAESLPLAPPPLPFIAALDGPGLQAPEPQVSLQSRPAVPVGADYRIGPGDVLRISVWEEPQFTTSAVVRPDGKISIPLISALPVAGMTPEAAQALLAEQLQKLVKHPRVTVIVEEIHSRIVYVTGEIQHPGAYPLIGSMNVVQLIARAGGPTEFAKKKEVYVLHQDGGPRIKINYQMVLAGKHLEENIGLTPGDTVVVP